MAFTLNQLAALEAAMGSGELKVKYDGKEVEYRSMSDLLKAREVVRAELIAAGLLTSTAQTNRGPASLAVFTRD
jgi:hypothetical protein